MKAEILKIMRESEDYVSGQDLCNRLGVSRTAVWKVIHQLKEEGYQIEAVRNKGYYIMDSPDVMTGQEVKSLLTTGWAGKEIVYYDEIDSTNMRLKVLAEEGRAHGTLVIADKQTKGKGRRGRNWQSEAGRNIYMSLLLRPDLMPDNAPMLTLVMAHSAVLAIRAQTGLPALIKWPNDIVVHGKKVCGILTEMSAEVDYIHHVVVGAGFNVNEESFCEELKDTATSLRIESGQIFKRAELIALILAQFEQDYERFMLQQNLSELMEQYNELLVNRDQTVKIIEPSGGYEAVALGINETGELLVTREDGTVQSVFAGEVSVRGVYGYV